MLVDQVRRPDADKQEIEDPDPQNLRTDLKGDKPRQPGLSENLIVQIWIAQS